ncbi:MAG: DUF4293 domain-containing protein [Bacteroidales bacterium]|jgi:hypothetical protein
MIQRIQSLFLLVAFVLSVIFAVHPISTMMLNEKIVAEYLTYGLFSAEEPVRMMYNTFPVIILAVVTALLSLITILIFKKRTLQMRLCVYNILLTLGLVISMAVYYFLIKKNFIVLSHAFSYTAIIPFLNIILIFQAFRGIRRDDLLLKSYNRLRD